ncbi:MAG: asparagine synthase (glutamine-hydrolyzing) [Candidatus Abyssobacteria bacterium SURF_5]|uniref:asparagine synthase (glutamine-hydrolyzing) n=1 Tax=Abyssobacteria bacterium (strain SURF_5) TaxID=2093360 RepID=A0A3A4NTX9_ABYX5|nr:MAG: asparagine synthase (glutamine-hydrolyzing) [Candidatus Abyssubacteria bacterium SURF_5]
MCGIVGYATLDQSPVDAGVLARMTDTLTHRGPDGGSSIVLGNIGLGHRRLSIIDLATGGQPMANEDGSVHISCNGEIYNFRELRSELEKAGHVFRTKSDVEVILHLYEDMGPECVMQLNGMFAFALVDQKKRLLMLARDRYGIKPLYYYHRQPYFLFASEIKALLANPAVRPELSYDALSEYFTFQNVLSDLTLFEGIRLMPSASRLLISDIQGSPRVRMEKYWDYHFESDDSVGSEEDVADCLCGHISTAVKRQLVSDVPVGSYLSGGIDSGSVVALASRHVPRLMTFTCGFDLSMASGFELGFDERAASEYMSSQFKTRHFELVLNSRDMQWVMPRLVWHLEDLRLGMCYPNYYVAELASRFVKVALSGTGGDELFGGYPWRYYCAVSQGFGKQQYLNSYYNYWQRLVPSGEHEALFNAETWRKVSSYDAFGGFCDVFKDLPMTLDKPERCVDASLYFEAKTFLHGLFLLEDKLAMAHGLEVRVPFLDNDLVDFAMKVPARYKLQNFDHLAAVDENEFAKKQRYYLQTGDGKAILRKAMADFLPPKVTERQKQGFSPPDESWYRGESVEYVKNVLLKKKAHLYDFLNYAYISKIINEHVAGKRNHRLLIWSLLCFEWWLDAFMHNNPLARTVESGIPFPSSE